MDRHVKWLRRRILASIATQTAEVFAVVAVVAFALMYWLAGGGPVTSLLGAVVVAQLVAVARIGHAMRNNPLNYVFMRKYVDRPFSYRVSRFQGEDDAHPVAARLPGFAPVATIRDSEADPEPIFDVYHDPSRLVAASVSRASGSVALISSLVDGRILVTDARALPPHERLVMNLTPEDSLDSVISTHRRAISARSDIAELASSAHQVVLESLAVEYDAYLALGPALSPFLDLEAGGRSFLRLTARIKPEELAELPIRLGPDMPAPTSRITPPAAVKTPPPVQPSVPEVSAPQVSAPQVSAPQVSAPQVSAPQVSAPQVSAPQVSAPQVSAPQVVGVDIAKVELAPLVIPPPVTLVPEIAAQVNSVAVVEPAAAEPAASEVVVAAATAPEVVVNDVLVAAAPIEIGPSRFVTLEPETEPIDNQREPITAEVPAVVFTQSQVTVPVPAPVPTPAAPTTVAPAAVDAPTLAPAETPVPAVAAAPVSAAAHVLASLPTVPTIDASLFHAPVSAVVAAPLASPTPASPAPNQVAPPVASTMPVVDPPAMDPAALVIHPPVSQTPEPVVAAAQPVASVPEPVAVTPQPVASVLDPVVVTPQPVAPAPDPVVVTPPPVASVPVATLAEAVRSAPDTAAALTPEMQASVAFASVAQAGAAQTNFAQTGVAPTGAPHTSVAPTTIAPTTIAPTTIASVTLEAPVVVGHVPGADVAPGHGPALDLATALSYTSPTSKPIPRLSEVLRANAPAGSAAQKRSRRKSR